LQQFQVSSFQFQAISALATRIFTKAFQAHWGRHTKKSDNRHKNCAARKPHKWVQLENIKNSGRAPKQNSNRHVRQSRRTSQAKANKADNSTPLKSKICVFALESEIILNLLGVLWRKYSFNEQLQFVRRLMKVKPLRFKTF